MLLFCVRFGPGGNLWPVLVLFWAFLIGLRIVTPPFVSSGSGLGFFVGTCLLVAEAVSQKAVVDAVA